MVLMPATAAAATLRTKGFQRHDCAAVMVEHALTAGGLFSKDLWPEMSWTTFWMPIFATEG